MTGTINTMLKNEAEIQRLHSRIRNIKLSYDIPWDEEDLMFGICTINEIRRQSRYPENPFTEAK